MRDKRDSVRGWRNKWASFIHSILSNGRFSYGYVKGMYLHKRRGAGLPAQTINKLHPRLASSTSPRRRSKLLGHPFSRYSPPPPPSPSLVSLLRRLHKRYGLEGLWPLLPRRIPETCRLSRDKGRSAIRFFFMAPLLSTLAVYSTAPEQIRSRCAHMRVAGVFNRLFLLSFANPLTLKHTRKEITRMQSRINPLKNNFE